MTEAAPSRLTHFAGSLGQIGVAITALLSLFSFAARYHFLADICSHFVNLYALAGFIGALLLLLGRRWGWVAFAVLVFSVNALRIAPLYIPEARASSEAGGVTLRVVSINVLSYNDHYDAVVEWLRETDADLILVQEITPAWADALRGGLPEHPHYKGEPRLDNFGIGVWSKTPLDKAAMRDFGGGGVPGVYGHVEIRGAGFFFVNLHTFPPISKAATDLRNRQMNEAAALVAGQPLPGMVAGDFNCSAWSPHFRDILRETGLRDARRGSGVSATWPTVFRPFMIPIDQCLVSPGVQVTDFSVGPPKGSDHLPLIIELRLPAQG